VTKKSKPKLSHIGEAELAVPISTSTVKPDVIQYTADARKYLFPRTAADVAARARKKPGTLRVQWKKPSKRVDFFPPAPSLSERLQAALGLIAVAKPFFSANFPSLRRLSLATS
jgi:hypothetical protein